MHDSIDGGCMSIIVSKAVRLSFKIIMQNIWTRLSFQNYDAEHLNSMFWDPGLKLHRVFHIMQPNIQAAVKISYGNEIILYLTASPRRWSSAYTRIMDVRLHLMRRRAFYVKYILADLHRPCLYLLVLRMWTRIFVKTMECKNVGRGLPILWWFYLFRQNMKERSFIFNIGPKILKLNCRTLVLTL